MKSAPHQPGTAAPGLTESNRQALAGALESMGLRATRQRLDIYAVLLAQPDHPTAEDVYERVRTACPGISLATVYNTLETLVEGHLVNRVRGEDHSARYCPNRSEHAHFVDERSGCVYDVNLPGHFLEELKKLLPDGFEARRVELSFTGHKRTDRPAPSRTRTAWQPRPRTAEQTILHQ